VREREEREREREREKREERGERREKRGERREEREERRETRDKEEFKDRIFTKGNRLCAFLHRNYSKDFLVKKKKEKANLVGKIS
jgi:hypothetical protein